MGPMMIMFLANKTIQIANDAIRLSADGDDEAAEAKLKETQHLWKNAVDVWKAFDDI